MTSQLKGEAKEVAKVITAIGKEIKKSSNPFNPPVCLLFGGETTVTVKGKNRRQHKNRLHRNKRYGYNNNDGWRIRC